jgi:hypothetical protein
LAALISPGYACWPKPGREIQTTVAGRREEEFDIPMIFGAKG